MAMNPQQGAGLLFFFSAKSQHHRQELHIHLIILRPPALFRSADGLLCLEKFESSAKESVHDLFKFFLNPFGGEEAFPDENPRHF